MKIVIIEDEPLAAERLERLIRQHRDDIELLAVLDSVENSVKWFNENLHPGLVFMDIMLADGISFEIFERTPVDVPVIFTTAYDEYTLRAFKVNSIDYLIKPVDPGELAAAMDKFSALRSGNDFRQSSLPMEKALRLLTERYKSRFMVKVGDHIRIIPPENILYFYSLEKATYLHSADNRNYPVDYTLENLEELLDPAKFFRINRKYMIRIEAIKDIASYSNSRLRIDLQHLAGEEVIVSREKTADFKKWLDR